MGKDVEQGQPTVEHVYRCLTGCGYSKETFQLWDQHEMWTQTLEKLVWHDINLWIFSPVSSRKACVNSDQMDKLLANNLTVDIWSTSRVNISHWDMLTTQSQNYFIVFSKNTSFGGYHLKKKQISSFVSSSAYLLTRSCGEQKRKCSDFGLDSKQCFTATVGERSALTEHRRNVYLLQFGSRVTCRKRDTFLFLWLLRSQTHMLRLLHVFVHCCSDMRITVLHCCNSMFLFHLLCRQPRYRCLKRFQINYLYYSNSKYLRV